MNNLSKKVAIVTGSGRGIGRTVALSLAQAGAKVVVNVKRNVTEGKDTVLAIAKLGCEGKMIQSDVSDNKEAKKLIDETIAAFGTIDILVNNAGVGIAKSVHDLDESLWDKQINANLKSTFLCSKYASEFMLAKRYGRIINISSVAGIIGMADLSAYSAAKAGVIGLSRAFAAEFSPYGITVNVVAAGLTRTKMGLSLVEFMKQKHPQEAGIGNLERLWSSKHTLTGKMLEGDDIARVVEFLAEERSANITGQIFVIDSGWSISEAANYSKL